MSTLKEFTKKLTLCYGVSGNEDKVREIIKKEISSFVDEIYTDNLGSLIARKKGSGKKILFAAHMDEIGLIITHIDKKGFLRFAPIGGVSPTISIGQRVMFKNGLKGVIGMEFKDIKPGSLIPLKKMFIDIGVNNDKEAEKKVNIGDMACFNNEFVELNNRWISKAMDDRIGCVVLVEAAKKLEKCKNDIYFVFTVQEEVGLRGARTSSYSVNPDLAIAVDVTATGDTPKGLTMAIDLSKGPALKIMDNSIIVTDNVKKFMKKAADKKKISIQNEILQFGGTDAGAMQMTKGGIPSGCVSIPTRYIHTPGEMIDKKDVEDATNWIVSMCSLDISKEGFGE